MDNLWYLLQRKLGKGGSLQLILISLGIHCLISIIIIYFHLNYLNSEQNKNVPSRWSRQKGGLVSARRSDEINLIVNTVLRDNQTDYNGWWFDHTKYDVNIQCFDSNWARCTKVFSTECKPDRIRAMYQFIPIKKGIYINELEVSLRTFSQHLIEEINDSIFGIIVIITLNDGTTSNIKIEFLHGVEGWIKRSANYKTPSNFYIIELTAMVLCYGYSGTFMFTDVYIIPESEMPNDSTRTDLVATCASDAYTTKPIGRNLPVRIENFNIPEFNTNEKLSHQVTLVTQVSLDRLNILEKTLQQWENPISLSIYVIVKNMQEGLSRWQRLYLEKKLKLINLIPGSNVAVIIGLEGNNDYPINILRNIAIKNVRTKYFLLVDADFQPCPELEKKFLSSIKGFNDTTKMAFVLPAFEYIQIPKAGDEIPRTKEEFLQLIFQDEPLVHPFRVFESVEAHRLTNYYKWYFSETIEKVSGFSDKFEPYLILEKVSSMPLFDERFTGYGMNKVTYVTELFAANYSFNVLHNNWIIHMPHEISSYFQEFLQNAEQRLKNRVQRFQFIKNLILKYDLKQEACNNESKFPFKRLVW